MIFHYCIGLHSEVTPPQKVVGEGTRNTAVPERARSTMHGSYSVSYTHLTLPTILLV